jgi:hypothetical protein
MLYIITIHKKNLINQGARHGVVYPQRYLLYMDHILKELKK